MMAPLLVGIAFGWVLQKAGMGRYEVVSGVFRFADLTVLKFLLSALVTAMVATQALSSLGLAHPVPVAETYLLGNLVGGLLFGVGMAVAGFCPGTVAAGAGEGRLDYLIPGSLGLIAGALLFGALSPRFFAALSAVGALGTVTTWRALGVDAWLGILLFAEAALLLLYALERGGLRPQRPRRA